MKTNLEIAKQFYEIWYDDQNYREQRKQYNKYKRPQQLAEEFLPYLQIVSDIARPNVVEIGARSGRQYRYYKEILECRHYVGVDVNPGPHTTILGSSHDLKTIEEAKRQLEHEPIDILFIDGDHHYEAAVKDYELWSPMVRVGGYIAFHDTRHRHTQYSDGAARYWPIVSREPGVAKRWHIYANGWGTPKTGPNRVNKQMGIGLIQKGAVE